MTEQDRVFDALNLVAEESTRLERLRKTNGSLFAPRQGAPKGGARGSKVPSDLGKRVAKIAGRCETLARRLRDIEVH